MSLTMCPLYNIKIKCKQNVSVCEGWFDKQID